MPAQSLKRSGQAGCSRAAAGLRPAVWAPGLGFFLAGCMLCALPVRAQTSQTVSPPATAQPSSAQQPSSGPMVMGQDPDSMPDTGGAPAASPAAPQAPAAVVPVSSQPAAAPLPPAAAASAVPMGAAAEPVAANAGGDAARQQINDECASLLKMANDLKAAVDKTTKDVLSVAVVRQANQIETLAHRVKDEMRPELGKK